MDTEAQVDERSASWPLIIDRIVSIVLLVVQPFLGIVQFLLIALGTSFGARATPGWAATTAYILMFLIALGAGLVTVVMLIKRRIAFWVPLLAMTVTSAMVVVLGEYWS